MTDKAIIRRGFLDLPAGQVHYRSAVADPRLPCLFILHQSPLSSRSYVRLLPLLAGTVRAFALDMPGYGASDAPPEEEWAIEAYAGFLFAVADKLGASRFHLFGRATGALVAASAARTRPERFLSLTLHGLPLYTAEEGRSLLAGYAPPYRLDEGGSHLAWIWDRIKHEYPWMDAAMATRMVEDYLAAGPDFAASYRAMWRYDVRKLHGGWTVPTLLIHGGRDRIAEMRPRAKALLPDAQEVFFDQATNFIAEQEPERFAACLLPFLEAHAPS
jgi:haloalkane dehalogenase